MPTGQQAHCIIGGALAPLLPYGAEGCRLELMFGQLRLRNMCTFLARLNESSGRAIVVTTASARPRPRPDWMFWLKFFKDLYLLNPWMDSFDTCTVVRYWSKV